MGTLAQPLREDPVGHNRFHAPTDSIIKTSEPAARLGAQSRLTALEGLPGAAAAQRLQMKVANVFVAKSDVQKMLREEMAKLEESDSV